MSSDGSFAAVSIVIKQLLAFVDISRGDENEVRDTVDVVEFGLAVPIFTVIYQPTHSTSLFCSIHTVGRNTYNYIGVRIRGCLIYIHNMFTRQHLHFHIKY